MNSRIAECSAFYEELAFAYQKHALLLYNIEYDGNIAHKAITDDDSNNNKM